MAWDSHNASSRNKYLQDVIGKEIVVWREPNDNKSQSNITAIIEKDLRKGSIDFLLELPGEKQNGYRYLILDTPQYREYLKFPNHLTNGGWVLISDLSFLKTKIGEN